MECTPVSPDINWTKIITIERCIYQNEEHYSSKKDLWEAIKLVTSNIKAGPIEKLNSMVERLMKAIECEQADILFLCTVFLQDVGL